MTDADELILRCRREPAAFRALVELFQMRIYSFLLHLAGRRTAEDLFQEFWLRVFRAAPSYHPRGKPASWLFKIAHNVALDHLRSQSRAPVVVGEETLAALPAPDHDPPRSAELAEAARRIGSALAELPLEQRQVFLLREYGGLPFKEIARVLDIPLGTALSRMNAALAKLRGRLEDLRA